MSIRLQDAEIEALCKVVKAALERAGVPEIGEVFTGPRHNEVGFETKDGGHVVLSMRGAI
jgi:hypothetical protein